MAHTDFHTDDGGRREHVRTDPMYAVLGIHPSLAKFFEHAQSQNKDWPRVFAELRRKSRTLRKKLAEWNYLLRTDSMTVRDVERLQEAIAHGEPLVNPAVRSTVAIGAAVSAELAVDWVKRILVGANQEAPAGEGPAVAFRAILGKLAEMGVEAVIRGERRHFSFLLAAEDLVAATIDIDETLTPILGRGLTEDERAYLRRLQAVGS